MFFAAVDHLILRSADDIQNTNLTLLRQQIDTIDRQILENLKARTDVSRRIAQIKQENNMTVFQPKRWETVLEKDLALARELGLDDRFVKELFEKIHAESVRVQEEALNGDKH